MDHTLADPVHAVRLPPRARELSDRVAAFLDDQMARGRFIPRCDAWLSGFDPAFSRALGERGWLGITWPREYGGAEGTSLERYAVLEQLLVSGAPVAAHWIAERQVGPSLLRFGSAELRARILPGIARGTTFCALGMSEPDSGSDLASVRTRALRRPGGWSVTGRKIWTSHAHAGHWLIALCRTGDGTGDRRAGLSQLVIDLSAPGVTVRPLVLMTGEHHFNEVVLDDVFVPDAYLLGAEGDGWHQVTAELALERSGPERFLSTYPLLARMIELADADGDRHSVTLLGDLLAELSALRQLSLRVAVALSTGEQVDVLAALVKDRGTRFEGKVVETARRIGFAPDDARTRDLFHHALLSTPGFTLRGGTNEILRSVILKGLGL